MNELNFARLLGGIDDDLITEATPEKRIIVKTFSWKYAAVASSIALVFCFLAMALVFSRKDVDTASESADASVTEETEYEKKTVKKDDSSKKADIDEPFSGTLHERINKIAFYNFSTYEKFNVTEFTGTHKYIKDDMLDKQLYENYYDSRNISMTNTTTNIYKIKDITREVAIAVDLIDLTPLFDELERSGLNPEQRDEAQIDYIRKHKPDSEEGYYIYINEDYKPKTLYQLGFETALKQYGSYGSAYYYTDGGKTIEFQGLDKQKVWDILFEDGQKCTVVEDPDKLLLNGEFKKKLDISTNIPVLGCENKSISISENGYLFTNILNKALIFNIGEEKAKNIIDYVKNNCKGYELVYREGDNSENAENASEQKEGSGTDESKTGV